MKLTNRFFIYYPEILAGLVVLILSAAFIMQYFFGFLPCKLCEIQRIPYYFILLVSVVYFCAKKSFKLLYVYLVMLACFIGAFVSFYHAGIEYGFFKNILNCEATQNFNDINQLKNYLENKIAVSCNEPVFKLIFSLSGWNFIISCFFIIYSLFFLKNIKRRI
ncbi:MAG: disulfide bond formation protein B [Rickettsiales bacterium]|nr:disulfide bond formation protein B [Rickettsiales bacterium]